MQQDLEALHRITGPGMVSRHDDIRRGCFRCLKTAPRFYGQAFLNHFRLTGQHAQNLTRPAQQMAHRKAGSEQPSRLANRLAHWVIGRVSAKQTLSVAFACKSLAMQSPQRAAVARPGENQLVSAAKAGLKMRQDRS